MNKVFKVAIEETVVGTFDICAESSEDALELAIQKYRAGELVLEPGEVVGKQITVVEPDADGNIWVEF